MAKVRRLLVEVIGDEARWNNFAATVKQDNIRHMAFQEEFARVLPAGGILNDMEAGREKAHKIV